MVIRIKLKLEGQCIQSTEKGVNYCVTMRRFQGYFPQILRPIVYALQNFDRNFPNLVAPPTDGAAKCLMRCKAYLVS